VHSATKYIAGHHDVSSCLDHMFYSALWTVCTTINLSSY
jgi:hypothetical protein